MAVEIGTATSHTDLLLKLETFLTTNAELVAANQQWQVMKDNVVSPYTTATTVAADETLMPRFFIGTGLDGKDKIVIPMVLTENKRNDYYCLLTYLAKSYNNQLGVAAQETEAGNIGKFVSMPLWDKPMKYWFIANGRRFIVVARVANRYSSMYAGFILPHGTDIEYSYPLFIGSNGYEKNIRYGVLDSDKLASFFNPTDDTYETGCATIYSPEGQVVYGYRKSDNPNYNKFNSFPYYANTQFSKTEGGNYVLLPIEFYQTGRMKQSLGWLDNVFYVSGIANTAENIVQVEGIDYLCIPSFSKMDYNYWAAIKLV